MTEKDKQDKVNKILFANLVMMFGSSAMQQLGKLINPMTGKTELDIEGAQLTIDMLSMIKEKTKGNLDKEEDKMLNDLLSSLQLNYVETAETAKTEKPQQGDVAAQTPASEPKPAGGDAGAPGVQPDSSKGGKDPKYHKAYGTSDKQG